MSKPSKTVIRDAILSRVDPRIVERWNLRTSPLLRVRGSGAWIEYPAGSHPTAAGKRNAYFRYVDAWDWVERYRRKTEKDESKAARAANASRVEIHESMPTWLDVWDAYGSKGRAYVRALRKAEQYHRDEQDGAQVGWTPAMRKQYGARGINYSLIARSADVDGDPRRRVTAVSDSRILLGPIRRMGAGAASAQDLPPDLDPWGTGLRDVLRRNDLNEMYEVRPAYVRRWSYPAPRTDEIDPGYTRGAHLSLICHLHGGYARPPKMGIQPKLVAAALAWIAQDPKYGEKAGRVVCYGSRPLAPVFFAPDHPMHARDLREGRPVPPDFPVAVVMPLRLD